MNSKLITDKLITVSAILMAMLLAITSIPITFYEAIKTEVKT